MPSIATAVAMLVCVLVIRWLLAPSSRLQLMDQPNSRSLHSVAVPRTGGVAMLLALFTACLLLILTDNFHWPLGFLGAIIAVATISFLDDLYQLSALIRLVVHIIAAIILLDSLGFLGGSLLWLFPAWIATVWMINLYNFMDGMDGFAAGMGVIGFGSFTIMGFLANDIQFATASMLIVAVNLVFLYFNFPPARIFMGDAGAATMGMLVAALGLWGIEGGLFPWWFPLLVFSPFIVDATVTLLHRLLRGERIWEAHRQHCYQQLVLFGWGHKKCVLAEYALMVATCCSALWLVFSSSLWQQIGLCVWALIYLLLVISVFRLSDAHA
ncbi:MAG: glycosyltransferase family 4 protein [Mariprofundaceae bacterium]